MSGTIFGIAPQALFGQLMLGLINGAFYAMLSLGLALIFGMLNIINFAHGALYMMGAFMAYLLLVGVDVSVPLSAYVLVTGSDPSNPMESFLGLPFVSVHVTFGINYWLALIIAPVIVGIFGMIIERLMLKPLYKLDHLYGLLLTFGLALILEGFFRQQYGVSGIPYSVPPQLTGAHNLGFMVLPIYRGWVVVASFIICIATWLLIEKTKLGSYLRAATENPQLVQAFGINVPAMITLTYGLGVGLAALGGVLAAPIYSVNPLMGSNLIIVVFAVVVIGGMGSILGSVITGFMLGILEGLTKVFYPEASSTVIFVVMAIVLLIKPAGLFGRAG